MSKIAVITDTHWGARGGSSLFREYMKEWWDSEFFRICKEQDIKIILHGGDFFDNRNSINLLDIDIVVNWFAEKLKELDLQFYVILGNHDVAHKNTNKIHSLALLKSSAPDNVHVIEEPKLIVLADQKFALVPWINNSNSDEILGFLDSVKSKESTIILGHFEFSSHKHYKNSKPAETGLDQSLFKEFKEVWSGHFHHPNKIGNTRYLGSSFYFNWQDYGDDRGFWIFEDNNLEYIRNDKSLFLEINFDDFDLSKFDDTQKKEFFSKKFTRIIINEEYKKADLLDTINQIQKYSPHDLQIVDNTIISDSGEGGTAESVEDKTNITTEEYVLNYIESNDDFNTEGVKELMLNIMAQANDLEVKGE